MRPLYTHHMVMHHNTFTGMWTWLEYVAWVLCHHSFCRAVDRPHQLLYSCGAPLLTSAAAVDRRDLAVPVSSGEVLQKTQHAEAATCKLVLGAQRNHSCATVCSQVRPTAAVVQCSLLHSWGMSVHAAILLMCHRHACMGHSLYLTQLPLWQPAACCECPAGVLQSEA
jgi:hypothetical protein